MLNKEGTVSFVWYCAMQHHINYPIKFSSVVGTGINVTGGDMVVSFGVISVTDKSTCKSVGFRNSASSGAVTFVIMNI